MKSWSVDLQPKNEPPWSAKIDRWYQLDEVCYAFCEALHQWQYLEDLPRPEVILLALPGASNVADQDFVASNATSPAKFVYTLPNIAAAVILQMLGFSCKVYCLHKGPETLAFVENEARTFARAGKSVWVFSSTAQADGTRRVEFGDYRAA